MSTETALSVKRLHPRVPEVELADLGLWSFRLNPTGLDVIGTPSLEQWRACGEWLRDNHERISSLLSMFQFAIGDWMNYGAHRWGDKYEDWAEELGYKPETIRDFAYVARSVQLSSRNDNLGFYHHRAVAPIKDSAHQRAWLKKAVSDHLSVEELRSLIFHDRPRKVHELESGNGKLHGEIPENFPEDHVYPDYGSRMQDVLRDCAGAFRSIQAKSQDADIREICVAMRERIDDLLAEL